MTEVLIFAASISAYLWAVATVVVVANQFLQFDRPWTRKRILLVAFSPGVILIGLGHLILWVSYVMEKPKWLK